MEETSDRSSRTPWLSGQQVFSRQKSVRIFSAICVLLGEPGRVLKAMNGKIVNSDLKGR